MTAPPDADLLTEIAAAAARLIAEGGVDYGSAKRKAAAELGADARRLPDNAQVEHELRRYLATFEGETHRRRLAALRRQALALMDRLASYAPHLVGAVLNGSATAHSDIHLHLFTDEGKELALRLLDDGVDFDAGPAAPHGAAQEELHFVVAPRDPALPPRVGVVLSVHARDAIRVAPRHRSADPALHPVEASGRADAQALRALLADAGQAA